MLFSCKRGIIIISCYPIKVSMKTQRTSIPRFKYGRLLLSFVSQCPICQNTFRTDHTLLQGPLGSCICCTLWLRHFTLIANLTYTPNVMHLISCMTLVSGTLRLRVANVCNYSIKSYSTLPGTIYSESGSALLLFPGFSLQQSALRGTWKGS